MSQPEVCSGCGNPILGKGAVCTRCKWGGVAPGHAHRATNLRESLMTTLIILTVAASLFFGCKALELLKYL